MKKIPFKLFPDIEAKLGLRISGVYLDVGDDGDYSVNMEVSGSIAKGSTVEVVATLNDQAGDVLRIENSYIEGDDFLGFDAISICFYDLKEPPYSGKVFLRKN